MPRHVICSLNEFSVCIDFIFVAPRLGKVDLKLYRYRIYIWLDRQTRRPDNCDQSQGFLVAIISSIVTERDGRTNTTPIHDYYACV